eukprot:jgi/Botrbrau1/1531/Bobra.0107s0019.1
MGTEMGEAHNNVTASDDGTEGNVEYDAAADSFVTEFTVPDEDEDEDEEAEPSTGISGSTTGGTASGQLGDRGTRKKTASRKEKPRASNPPPHLPKHPTRRLPAPGWDPLHWKRQKDCLLAQNAPAGPGHNKNASMLLGKEGTSRLEEVRGVQQRMKKQAGRTSSAAWIKRRIHTDTGPVFGILRLALSGFCNPYTAPGTLCEGAFHEVNPPRLLFGFMMFAYLWRYPPPPYDDCFPVVLFLLPLVSGEARSSGRGDCSST